MDFKNKSIAVENITSFDVNKTIQRSLTKAVARHGLGLYVYAGEDLPNAEASTQPEYASDEDKEKIKEICKANNWSMEQILIASGWRKGTKLTQEQYGKVLLVIKNRLELKGEA